MYTSSKKAISKTLFPLLFSLFFYNFIFADTLLLPQVQSVPLPKMPTVQVPQNVASNHIALQNPMIKPMEEITNNALKRKMLLESFCLMDKINEHNLRVSDIKRLGIPHHLSFQYQDNLLRLKGLLLKAVPKEMQKELILKKKELEGVVGFISFLESGVMRHHIILLPNFLQIDEVLFESNAKILHIFQSYFCHPYTREQKAPNISHSKTEALELLKQQKLLPLPSYLIEQN